MDFREFLKAFDGMDDGETDDGLNRFLPITELYPICDPTLPTDCFVFMDCSFSAYLVAIHLSKETTDKAEIFVLGVPSPVAHSFADFIRLYLAGVHLRIGA